MIKGTKKYRLVAECNNKAEMINRALYYIKEMEGDKAIYFSKWSGEWDGVQWSSMEVYVSPLLVEKHSKAIYDEFKVKVVNF